MTAKNTDKMFISTLSGLDDVTMGTEVSGQHLMWDGTAWVNSDSGFPFETLETLSVALDPVSGEDPTGRIVAATQADIDAIEAGLTGNAFATLAGVQSVLPREINFDVTVTVPDGTYTISGSDLGDWTNNKFNASVIVSSASITTQVPTTSGYTVDSVTSTSAVLASSPGWGADARQGDFIKIITGSKAGSYRSVMKSPDDLTYQIGGKRYINATDTFEFHQPAATFNLVETTDIKGRGGGGLEYVTGGNGIEFRGIDFTGSSGLLVATGILLRFTESRVTLGSTNIYVIDSALLFAADEHACVFDGTDASSGTCIYAFGNSFIRSSDTGGSPSIINNTWGVFLSDGSNSYIFNTGYADLTVAEYCYGSTVYVNHSLPVNSSATNVDTFIALRRGAVAEGTRSGAWTTMPAGDVTDIDLDGQTYTWTEMEEHRVLEGPLGSRYQEFEL